MPDNIKPEIPWPPQKGKDFIRSDAFGKMLVELVNYLSHYYPRKDFTDAIALVYVWFDNKLSKNRRFINKRRFPTINMFKAYLRQAVWNASRATERRRARQLEIETPTSDYPITRHISSPEEQASIAECVDKLPETHKTVFSYFFFQEVDPSMICSILSRSESEIHSLYQEALDMLGDCLRII